MRRVCLNGNGTKIPTQSIGEIHSRRRDIGPGPESRRRGNRGNCAHLRRVRAFTEGIERRDDVVISRPVGEPGVGIGGRGGRCDLGVGPAVSGGALDIIARRPTTGCPSQGDHGITGGCDEIGRRCRWGARTLRCRGHLRGIRTLASTVHGRYDVVIRRPIGDRGIRIPGRGGRGHLRVRSAAFSRTFHVIARRAAAGRPSQGYHRVTGGCRETRRHGSRRVGVVR